MILYYFSCLFWKYSIVLLVYRLKHAQEFKKQPFSPPPVFSFLIKTYIIYAPIHLEPAILCRYFDPNQMHIGTGSQHCQANLKIFSLFVLSKFIFLAFPWSSHHHSSHSELFGSPTCPFYQCLRSPTNWCLNIWPMTTLNGCP